MSLNNDNIYILDYGGGNVRSLVSGIESIGYNINYIKSPNDFIKAEKLIFPGVGHFEKVMEKLKELGYYEPLKDYLLDNKPFLGICVGFQCLFEGSEEVLNDNNDNNEVSMSNGLSILKGKVKRFLPTKAIPHMGWNTIQLSQMNSNQTLPLDLSDEQPYYFVHSYCVPIQNNNINKNHLLAISTYEDEPFIAAIKFNNIIGVQFHPEKSGKLGLDFLNTFLLNNPSNLIPKEIKSSLGLRKRIVVALDVTNDEQGTLIVTKGNQYEIIDPTSDKIRKLGDPVELSEYYYQQGIDEICFLNITSYRNNPLNDQPMLEVLKKAASKVFIPLTVGGGITDFIASDGSLVKAESIAEAYFRCGADKVAIGSDAVKQALQFYENSETLDGTSSIERISKRYGAQAVVISIDPKRVYTNEPNHPLHKIIKTKLLGPNNEQYCWFQATIHGGRTFIDLDVIRLIKAVTKLGAGELMLNSLDKDGTNTGFDLELIELVKMNTTLPVVASSGAGKMIHFKDLFDQVPNVEAGLAAGIFHREEVKINKLKEYLDEEGVAVRL